MPRAKREQPDVVAIRLTPDLVEALNSYDGPSRSAVCRDLLRQAIGIPLDHQAGYREGFSAGWADAADKFRAALKTAATNPAQTAAG